MTTTEPTSLVEQAADDERGGPGAHKPTSFYVKVALTLALVTAIEVGLYYLDIGKWFVPAVLILMVIKFTTVVSLFMHLRYDNTIFSWLFYTGVFLAIFVYVIALLTFRVFDPGT